MALKEHHYEQRLKVRTLKQMLKEQRTKSRQLMVSCVLKLQEKEKEIELVSEQTYYVINYVKYNMHKFLEAGRNEKKRTDEPGRSASLFSLQFTERTKKTGRNDGRKGQNY